MPPTPAFSLRSKAELKSAVAACLELSRDCFEGPHGPIGEWDVSSVTDMSQMFSYKRSFKGDISKWDLSAVKDMSSMFTSATSFNGDISKWDVSSVIDMSGLFMDATSFNGDISKWDVSSVTTMAAMFMAAAVFNGDISKWDVSSVNNMNYMFKDAVLFNQKLCGAAWVHSKASKTLMFARSPGTLCDGACRVPPIHIPDSTLPQTEPRLKQI